MGNAVSSGLRRAVVAGVRSAEFRTLVGLGVLVVVNLAAEDNATSIGGVRVEREFNTAVRVGGTARSRNGGCCGFGSNDSDGHAGVGLAAA